MSDIVAHQTLSRMHNREQAISEDYLGGFSADMTRLAKSEPAVEQEKYMNQVRGDLCEAYGMSRGQQNKAFPFANGVAVIPVHGSLINRFGASYSFVTGYNYIRAMHNAALLDPEVTHIIHDHNSFGGEVAGCNELADDIYNSRGQKPIVAVVDSNCYSASYWLASAADRIVVTPSAGVGSIGTRAMHVDMSKMLKMAGIEVTFIYSGDHKVDGNPYESLPASVKADIKKGVDKSRAVFVSSVARNRGLTEKIVYDTQARTYRAEEAKDLGLVDAIAAPNAALELITSDDWWDAPEPSLEDATQTNPEKKTMATPEELKTLQENAAAANAALAAAQASSQVAAAPAAAATPAAVVPAASAAAGATQVDAATIRAEERARVSAITTSEHAAGREKMANHLAMNTAMPAADAVALLQVSPKEGAAPAAPAKKEDATADMFQQAMANTAQPNVGANGGDAAAGDSAAQELAKVEKDYFLATGRKLTEL